MIIDYPLDYHQVAVRSSCPSVINVNAREIQDCVSIPQLLILEGQLMANDVVPVFLHRRLLAALADGCLPDILSGISASFRHSKEMRIVAASVASGRTSIRIGIIALILLLDDEHLIMMRLCAVPSMLSEYQKSTACSLTRWILGKRYLARP